MDLRSRILEEDDLKREPVAVPEWPSAAGEVFAKTFTGQELFDLKAEWFKGVPEGKDAPEDRVKVLTVIWGAVDKDGKAIFQLSDVDALKSRKAGAPIARIFNAIATLNGLTKVAEEKEKKD